MDNIDNMSHYELQRLHAEAKKMNNERQKLYSKRNLSSLLTKKFKTTMIGALASFEEIFGHLWGHGKESKELNENEVLWKEHWEHVRTDILNKGNSQLRASLEELNNYELDWKKYKTELIVKQDRNNE